MEYLAKKSCSFLQDCAFTSVNIETYTNKWNILQKSRFPFCKILHLLVKAFLKIYITSFIFHWYTFLQKFRLFQVSTSNVFYKLVNSPLPKVASVDELKRPFSGSSPPAKVLRLGIITERNPL